MAGLRVRSMDGGCQGGAVLAQGLAQNFAIAFGGLWSGLCGCARPPGPHLMQVRGLVWIFATAFGGLRSGLCGSAACGGGGCLGGAAVSSGSLLLRLVDFGLGCA